MNYANQLKIDFTGVDEAVKPKKGQPFICCDQNILTEAAKHLTYSEYRLFLCMHQSMPSLQSRRGLRGLS